MLEATRQQYEQQLSAKDEAIAAREQGVRDKEKEIAEARRTVDAQVADQVAQQLKSEGAVTIVAAELKTFVDRALGVVHKGAAP